MGKTQKIVGAVLVFLAIALGAYAWLLSQRMAAKQKEAEPKLHPVVVAATRIPAGSIIKPEMLKQTMFPAIPEGAYSDVTAVAGKVTASDIAAGEPLLHERLEGLGQPMLQHLKEGERAVAIRVDEVIAVGNRLLPGDRVDLYATFRRNTEEIDNSQARLLLADLTVLTLGSKDLAPPAKSGADGQAVGRTPNPEPPKTVVLAVKAENVRQLALAADSGRLLLALRPKESSGDADKAVTPAASTGAPGGQTTKGDSGSNEVVILKNLVASNDVRSAGISGVTGRGKGAVARAPVAGSAVAVMHGLQEKTIHVEKNQPRAVQ